MPPVTDRQHWQAESYARNAGYVPELGSPVIDLLDPRPGERILDLGCGDGVLTEKIAARGAAVVGFDASPDLAAAARARGLEVRLGDAHALDFAGEFDAVFSNAALHWMTRPDEVIAGVRRALKPGGRFVGEFGGHGNVAAITVALIAVLARRGVDGPAASPWYFPTAEDYRARLEAHGFQVDTITLSPRPTPVPAGMAAWLEVFAGSFLSRIPAEDRPAAAAEVIDLLKPVLCDRSGRWTADHVRLRFAARLVGAEHRADAAARAQETG